MSSASSPAPSSPTFSSASSRDLSAPSSPLVLASSFVGDVLAYNNPDATKPAGPPAAGPITKPAGPKYQKKCKTCNVIGHTTPTCDKRFCTHCQYVGHTLSQCPKQTHLSPALKKAKVMPLAGDSLLGFLGQTLITKFTADCEAECARKVADYTAKVGSMTVEQLCQEMSAHATAATATSSSS